MLRRETQSLLQTLDQGGAHRTAGHPNRAVDDGQILLPGLEQHVLEALGGVALISGDEAGGQLDPRCPQPGVPGHILSGEYPACCKDWDRVAVFLLVGPDLGQHAGEDLLQSGTPALQQFILMEAQVAAGL